MYIVAIAWIYVVLLMSLTEETVVSGVMTFTLYGILPLTIILYLMDSRRRKRLRAATRPAEFTTAGVSNTLVQKDAVEPPPPRGLASLHEPPP
ncbi:MAG: hypothetical protein NVSMB6_02650 [Burkholderiaceae bacterium]